MGRMKKRYDIGVKIAVMARIANPRQRGGNFLYLKKCQMIVNVKDITLAKAGMGMYCLKVTKNSIISSL